MFFQEKIPMSDKTPVCALDYFSRTAVLIEICQKYTRKRFYDITVFQLSGNKIDRQANQDDNNAI